jgi:hypothetical protein
MLCQGATGHENIALTLTLSLVEREGWGGGVYFLFIKHVSLKIQPIDKSASNHHIR